MKAHNRRINITDKMLLFGVGMAIVYWVLDSVIYLLLSQDVTFFQGLFGYDINGLSRRLLALCFFMIFGSHAQYTITLRKEAEEALHKSEERYRTIVDNIEDGYYEVDIAGKFNFINESLCRILGYAKDKILGVNIRRFVDEESTRKFFETFNTVHETGKASKALDWALTREDGSEVYVESSVTIIKDAEDQAVGFRGILRDITERKQAEALMQAKLAAEGASQAKSEFLANMSHEIRTPLNSIIGLVELLKDTDLGPEQREDLDVVISSAYALLAVINDILDFSKIEAGKLELENIPFMLRDFLGEALRIMAIKAHEKGLELAYRVSPEIVPDQLIGDPSRFRQVLLNLVGNAIKFTDNGEVIVSVELEKQTETEVDLRFSVTDTGVGIPEDKLENIFSAFQQADGSTSRRFGGTGLGLAVSSQLVNLMGGQIWAESKSGAGSTFYFTSRFRAQPGAEDPFELPPEVDIRGVRVLVVDDNETNREIIQEMLDSWGLISVTASGTEEAQQILNQVERSRAPFELVLVDSDMPEPGGISLVEWINDQETLQSNIIMMLASSSLRSQIDLPALGVKTSIIKPVRPSDLLDAIMVGLGFKVYEPEEPSEMMDDAVQPEESALKVLVAEDTPFNQKFILRLLSRWGYQAVLVENGRLAVEALSREKYDLVLMDIQMPEMDGLEAARTIRESEKETGGHVPIIALTAHAMKSDRERCLAAGMDEYISKPISPDALHKAIKMLVSEEPHEVSGKEQKDDAVSAINKEALLAAFEHDRNFLKEIVDMFINDYPSMMTNIQEAVASADGEKLHRSAHSIKGMLRNFQAESAAQIAMDLEKMGQDEAFEDAAQACEALDAELTKLENALRSMLEEIRPNGS